MKSIYRVFKYDTRQELMDKYKVLLEKYYLHNQKFFIENDNGKKKYVLTVYTKILQDDSKY